MLYVAKNFIKIKLLNMNQEKFAKNNIIPLIATENFHLSENKSPFNYINYWNYINDEYFKRVNEKKISNTAQIVHRIISNGNSYFFNLVYIHKF